MTGELLAVLGDDRLPEHSVSVYALSVSPKGRVCSVSWRCLCGLEGGGDSASGAIDHLHDHGIEVTAR